MTRARDALSAQRRMLPDGPAGEGLRLEGTEGRVTLPDLFHGRRQLMVSHFMVDPEWDDGCPSCTAGADETSDGLFAHLHARDTTLVCVSRAPLAKLEDYKFRRGWTFPWYSSYGSDFNDDFNVTMDPAVAPPVYNYRPYVGEPGEMPGLSCFLRSDDAVFHTYSLYARGAEMLGGSYDFLDLTALGRQEEWEEPKGRVAAAHAASPDFAP